MKSINFINPVPPQKQKALIYWLYGSLILIISILLFLGYLHIKRLHTTNSLLMEMEELKKQTADFDTIVSKKKTLLETKKNLEEQLKKTHAFQEELQAPHSLCLTLASITPPSICLKSLQGISGKSIIIEGIAHNPKAVTQYVETLHNCALFSDVHLGLLMPVDEKNPNDTPIKFKIEGIWKKQAY